MGDHHHHDEDNGVSRRRVLECMTWAGTGVLWTITGGVPHSLGMVGSAAWAASTIPSERGTPPVMVQSTPVPAQVMHSRTLRRLTPSPWWS